MKVTITYDRENPQSEISEVPADLISIVIEELLNENPVFKITIEKDE